MKPADELAACKQALSQYRRAWRELALKVCRQGLAWRWNLSEIARKHGLPVMPPADETPNAPAVAQKSPQAGGSGSVSHPDLLCAPRRDFLWNSVETDSVTNAEAHGRRSRTVQPLVGHSESEG